MTYKEWYYLGFGWVMSKEREERLIQYLMYQLSLSRLQASRAVVRRRRFFIEKEKAYHNREIERQRRRIAPFNRGDTMGHWFFNGTGWTHVRSRDETV